MCYSSISGPLTFRAGPLARYCGLTFLVLMLAGEKHTVLAAAHDHDVALPHTFGRATHEPLLGRYAKPLRISDANLVGSFPTPNPALLEVLTPVRAVFQVTYAML